MRNIYIIKYLIVVLILLSGCNSGNTPSNAISSAEINKTSKQVLKSTGQNLPYTMGGTYDIMSGYPTSPTSCLNAGANPNAIVISNPQASLNFTEEQSLQEVMNALGINIAVTVGWGPFAVTTTYNYANSSQDDAYTLNLNYIYKYSGKAIFPNSVNMQGESALTPSAQAVLGLPQQFRQMCGDRFISQMDAGATVLFRLKLKFNSTEEKNYFSSAFTSIHGLSGVLSLIMSNPNHVNFTLYASGMQVGGDPSQFNNVFTAANGYESQGYMTVNCGQAQASTCIKLVNNIINYTSSIASQLSNPDNFYFSNPTISTWSSIGVHPGDVNPDPQVLTAMQNLTSMYNTDQQTYQFITEYTNRLNSESFLSSTMSSDLSNLAAMYQQILYVYSNPSSQIMDCYNGFVSANCINIYNNIAASRQQILNDYPALLNQLSYIENNEYAASLLINPANNNNANCGLYPITENTGSLYIVNCNGQVSGSFDASQGISITSGLDNSLQISNLNYTYINPLDPVQQTNQFNYQFSQPLFINGFYQNVYLGNANVFVNGSEVSVNQRFSLGLVPY